MKPYASSSGSSQHWGRHSESLGCTEVLTGHHAIVVTHNNCLASNPTGHESDPRLVGRGDIVFVTKEPGLGPKSVLQGSLERLGRELGDEITSHSIQERVFGQLADTALQDIRFKGIVEQLLELPCAFDRTPTGGPLQPFLARPAAMIPPTLCVDVSEHPGLLAEKTYKQQGGGTTAGKDGKHGGDKGFGPTWCRRLGRRTNEQGCPPSVFQVPAVSGAQRFRGYPLLTIG